MMSPRKNIRKPKAGRITVFILKLYPRFWAMNTPFKNRKKTSVRLIMLEKYLDEVLTFL